MKHTVSLKENHLFRRLYSKGKSAAAPTVAVYVRPNRLAKSRLGVTVGTKVGKAVRRNRVRRRIREIYRVHENRMCSGHEDQVLGGRDVVVVARVRSAHAPYAEIERDLLRLLDKLGVYQKKGEGHC